MGDTVGCGGVRVEVGVDVNMDVDVTVAMSVAAGMREGMAVWASSAAGPQPENNKTPTRQNRHQRKTLDSNRLPNSSSLLHHFCHRQVKFVGAYNDLLGFGEQLASLWIGFQRLNVDF